MNCLEKKLNLNRNQRMVKCNIKLDAHYLGKSLAIVAIILIFALIVICYNNFPMSRFYSAKKINFLSLSAALKKDLNDVQAFKLSDIPAVNESQQKIRILCLVLTDRRNHRTHAEQVKATWGKRCNILYFVSSVSDDTLPSIAFVGKESREILWGKTKLGFQYAYHKHLNDADWFLKADDDTYVVMENLRYFLQDKNASDPQYFGCNFKMEGGYMSGGSGYILSKSALEKFVDVALNDTTGELCKTDDDGGPEDVEMGKCLRNVNVTTVDTRDESGRLRFIPVKSDYLMAPRERNENYWLWTYLSNYSEHGEKCCSNATISFHYVSPDQMHVLEFLIYRFKVFGLDF